MRTTAYSELAVYAPGHEIAFEIDQLDSERRRGWSVVAHGVCERLEQPSSGSWHRDGPGPEPWAGGFRPLWLRLAWRELHRPPGGWLRTGRTRWSSGRGRGY